MSLTLRCQHRIQQMAQKQVRSTKPATHPRTMDRNVDEASRAAGETGGGGKGAVQLTTLQGAHGSLEGMEPVLFLGLGKWPQALVEGGAPGSGVLAINARVSGCQAGLFRSALSSELDPSPRGLRMETTG